MTFPRLTPRAAPTLSTERLTVRPMELGDWPTFGTFMTSDRTVHMGGPWTENVAWTWFVHDVTAWEITGGGGLTVANSEGAPVGQIVLNDLPAFPEPELGWLAYDGHEGAGYISEAARRVLDWVREDVRPTSLVSYIDPLNARSIAVADRLGAVRDDAARRPEGETAEDTAVYRHDVTRVA